MSTHINNRSLRPGQDPLGYKDKPVRRRRRSKNRNNHKGLRTFGAIILKGVMPLCVIWWAFSPMFTNATGSDIIAEEAIDETPADSVVVVTENNSTPQVEAPAPKAVDIPTTTTQEAAPSDTKPEQADVARQPATDVVHVESLDEISAEITPETTVEIPADAPVIE